MIHLKPISILLAFAILVWGCYTKKSENKEGSLIQHKNTFEQVNKRNPKAEKIKTQKKEFKGDGYTITYQVIVEGNEVIKNRVHDALLKSLAPDSKYKNLEDFEKLLKAKKYSVKSDYCNNASRDFSSTIYQVGKVVSINNSEYTFDCGAHGNGYTEVQHFHLETGRPISLNDIFKNQKGLKDEVEKQFCADNKLEKNLDAYISAGYEGFADGFILAKNYFFDDNGISFFYNAYEVGPYTLPPFAVKVKYDKIKPFLHENNLLEM
ncbi:MAG: RsiV family protein [Bacteroidia bacterium]|nr:RsiV family protein [Bacteroidia bacterium]MDW8347106.1 RsiV family protein [Bacteroidia bacterium]